MYYSEKDNANVKGIKQYLDEHNGDYPRYYDVDVDGNEIGCWLNIKLQRLRIGSVSDEEIVYLKSTGIDYGIKLLTWYDWFQLLSDYFTNNGANRIPDTYIYKDKYKLGQWAKRQISKYRDLNFEQKRLIGNLNWPQAVEACKIEKEKEDNRLKYLQSSAYHVRLKKEQEREERKRLFMEEKRKEQARKEELVEKIENEYQKDTALKKDLRLKIFKSECMNFSSGPRGITIYASIENVTDHCIDIEVMDFTLMKEKINVRDDGYLKGYFLKNATLLPYSSRTTTRIYQHIDYVLFDEYICSGDTVDLSVRDVDTNTYYYAKFEYFNEFNNSEWVCTYVGTNTGSNDDFIEEKLRRYKHWLDEDLISEEDYYNIREKLLKPRIEGEM